MIIYQFNYLLKILLIQVSQINYYNCFIQKENVDDTNEKYTHLTNAAIQKKHPNFQKYKENTIWSMEKFEKYAIQNYNVTQKQLDELKRKIKQILTYVMRAAQKKLDKKTGCFELLGCDILIGSDFTPYLIEMNHNPAIHLDTLVQSQVIPQVVHDALDIALSINLRQEKVDQIIKGDFDTKCFTTLINESTNYCFLRSQKSSSLQDIQEIKEVQDIKEEKEDKIKEVIDQQEDKEPIEVVQELKEVQDIQEMKEMKQINEDLEVNEDKEIYEEIIINEQLNSLQGYQPIIDHA